ncbi:hypothetical protein TGGT1_219175 [Toxoplasma gondii GT1]|uniref:Transmembrane protein n=5 Tax=Toxoplasma gondii TaxID=5811 RepID=S7V1L9_TOXGG|nr:hypothetical protein TGGT1_219175 [Toxoplasma gondii GT1]KAF4638233.1 hypothetical protein TGRH88_058410 [Toxoplasma gondii]KFH05129.1 putative transmembrane protein [Toxoplasma gondii VAND]KFH15749.1 putative transmembrane protein [Toxoplasma gondii MAS]RQX71694.1 putative transmembrane protein [Toxoplasma gondii CAST]
MPRAVLLARNYSAQEFTEDGNAFFFVAVMFLKDAYNFVFSLHRISRTCNQRRKFTVLNLITRVIVARWIPVVTTKGNETQPRLALSPFNIVVYNTQALLRWKRVSMWSVKLWNPLRDLKTESHRLFRFECV